MRPVLNYFQNFQFYCESRIPDEFREMSEQHFMRIYKELGNIVGQLKIMAERDAHIQQLVPYTFTLRAETEKFATDISRVVQQQEKIFPSFCTSSQLCMRI